MDIQGFARDGSNLVINLADGRVVVLDGYYSSTGAPMSRLFISADGYLNEVSLSEGGDGPVYAQYGPTEHWTKWSPDEELIFLGGSDLTAPVEDDEVSMLGAALLGGGGLLGLGGVGAAAVAAAVVAGGSSPRSTKMARSRWVAIRKTRRLSSPAMPNPVRPWM